MLAIPDNSTGKVATVAAVAAATSYLAYSYLNSNNSNKKWRRVGKVDRLTMFPLKSGAPVDVTGSASFMPMGMKAGTFRDREFCVVRAHKSVLLD